MTQDLLFEIGVEEVPARFMPGTLEELAKKSESILKENRLKYKEIKTYGTPRRLTLYVKDLAERQEDLVEEKRGPSKKAAIDAEGNFTKAAQGFARGCGVDVNDLYVKELKNGEYIFAKIKNKGKKALEVLPEILKEVVLSLTFPKPMRWGNSNMRFIRPIKWLVALFGTEVIPLQIEDIKADRVTKGHRFLGSDQVVIDRPDEYFEKLKKEYVLVDQNERRELIWKQIIEVAEKENGIVEEDPELLEEVTYLLEYPTALAGSFDEDFLELPQEVLITPMKEHQRYFPVQNKEGELLPRFITVRNGTEDNLEIVAKGNEKVLEARLADAKFFYEEDIKVSLEERVKSLKNVVFQEKLGTIYDKVMRIVDLSEYIGEKLELEKSLIEKIKRCAYLAKSDLITSMVYEFPELQGIMGEYYALHDKESEEVAKGIREHYQPRFSGDQLPESIVGTVVAIADKIDTIIGCFAAGIEPTGSQDPYGLRRQALGVSNIIKEKELELSLKDLFSVAYKKFPEKLNLELTEEEVVNNVGKFFEQRFANILEEEGVTYDVVNAVLNTDWESGNDIFKKAEALTRFRGEEEFKEFLNAFTRVANIAKKAETTDVAEELFEEESEKSLWSLFKEVTLEATPYLNEKKYYEALKVISKLTKSIDNFFDNVMVMVEDEKIKNNRLSLLKSISDFLKKIADLSQIVV